MIVGGVFFSQQSLYVPPEPTPEPARVSLIDGGGSHGYALVDGEVYSTGWNYYGQLGLGDTNHRNVWTPTGLTGVTTIAAGDYHGYALVDGEVYSVGRNSNGQLGLGDQGYSTTWTPTGLSI